MTPAATPRAQQPPPPMPSIVTARLELVPQVAAHADEMFELLQDAAIYRYENAPPASVEWLSERFARLETRASAAGDEQWLNWVVRLPDAGLIGYVQATVHANASAGIAYVFASTWWGNGFAREAVQAMMRELADAHGVTSFRAVLKRTNARSHHLLECLGFVGVEADAVDEIEAEEALMVASGDATQLSAGAPAPAEATGGCLCGSTRYRLAGAPLALGICHCRSCQRASGAPSVAWVVVARADFSITHGSVAAFASSPGVRRTFCPTCDTPLTYQNDDSPQTVDIATATFDHPAAFAPMCEIWMSHRIAWASVNPALPRYDRTKAEHDGHV